MGPDYEKYRPFVAELDIDEDKKDQIIDVVWSMMKSFVDAGFGDDPVQLAVEKNNDDSSLEERNGITSRNYARDRRTEVFEP